MNTYSDELHGQLVERIGVLTDETERLTEARRILVGPDVTPQRKSARKIVVAPAPELTGRQQQALALVGERPGITAAQIGPALGLHDLTGYGLVNKLAEHGLVTKRERGWYPA